jgi:ATP-dependent helicase HrpA
VSSDPVAPREELPVAAIRRRLGALRLRDEHRLERKLDRLRHQRDPDVRSRDLTRLLAEIDQGEAIVARQRAAVPTVNYPENLPVSARRDDLLAAIRDHQVVVVAGETGSGKTTQLPKICLELGRGVRGQIAHTQPRRIAARTVAERIADELGAGLGDAIGYSVRFNDRSGDDTLVRLMTDGLLLAELQRDRLLRRYDTIIIDEAHERSLNIDFLLGQLKQILPRRPDLKLIITSATIDPERFATHFADARGEPAPIIEVSGRTYPVEVRYRPVVDPDDPDADPDRDQTDAICDAVEELAREPEGDVLVFLSGEREIRDTAEALNGRFGGGKRSGGGRGARSLQILPLYARLSTAEQQKVFRRSSGDTSRRVVLATNVAETSLTVPGIKYVIDPGNARISRYSAKLKVQRLPIERISQASANQRKGRCGRTSDGICIRLYSEDDFLERPEFTDPEILRTNLASVILQMAALGLGEVADFPFLEPPDRAQVRDGTMLLHELGAIDPAAEDPKKRLTALGRKLARLPIDPRMGRMVLEADRLGVTEEVVVIAAALSIQDPRERPTDKQEAAAQSHARFKHPKSDFLGFLNLWEYLSRQQRELSGSRFRKTCKQEFLHYLRIREWQDLVAQLRQAAKQVGITVPRTHGRDAPALDDAGEPVDVPRAEQQIHIALLSGLLSHLGLKDETQKKDQRGRDKQRGGRDRGRSEYLGARGARFQIFPGSALAKKPPTWTMVAELVETSRLWGRTAAEIQPEWVEPLAEHLLKRTYAEPRWSRKRASVVASERATLYGLPIVAGRTVQYGKLDPVVSRELFIQHALVEGDWDGRHRFIEQNRALIAEVEAMEERARRRGILVEDDAIYAFFDERIPEDVVSGAHFDTWWKRERQRDPDRLTFPRSLLIEEQAASVVGPQGRMAMPDAWKQGDHLLPLSYRFEPGTEDDGVTVHIPLTLLPQIKPVGFEWLVPGLREELVTALVRALPKEIRRELVPIPDTVARVLERVTPRSAPLPIALARELNELPGVQLSPKQFDLTALPPHLRIRFVVEDEAGQALAAGHDLDALREQVRPKLKAKLQAATPDLERHGLTSWSFGPLPRAIGVASVAGADAGELRVYPALVDEGETVGIRSLDTPDAQATAMTGGIRRLLLLTIPSPERYVRGQLDMRAQLSLATAPHGSVDAVITDTIAATVDGLAASKGGVAWNEDEFRTLRDHVAGHLADATVKVLQQVVRILDAEREVRARLERLAAAPTPAGSPFDVAQRDVTAQLRRLIFPGFVAATGARRLPDVVRYLQAAAYRLDRLPDQKAADADRTRAIHELEAAYEAKLDGVPPGAAPSAELREVRWMLEELRVNQFAQTLTRQRGGLPVSAKRIRKVIEGA